MDYRGRATPLVEPGSVEPGGQVVDDPQHRFPAMDERCFHATPDRCRVEAGHVEADRSGHFRELVVGGGSGLLHREGAAARVVAESGQPEDPTGIAATE